MSNNNIGGYVVIALALAGVFLLAHGKATLTVDPNCTHVGDSRCVINP